MANFFSRFWNTEDKPEPKTEIRSEAEKPAEERAISSLPFSNWATESTSGIHISTRNALSIPTVLSAVGTVADTISTLPLPVFKNSSEGGEKDYNHPLYNLLNSSPNEVQTAKAFRHAMIVDLLIHGETFCEIERNNAGGVLGIWRIEPSLMRVQWSQDGRFLRYWANNVEIDAANIIHVLGFSENGIRGASPFVLCKDSLGLTIALEQFGSGFFKNGARPGGILQMPPGLSVEDREDAKKSWNQAHSGTQNVARTACLPNGFSYQPTNLAPEEGQFNESRIYQMRECQRITRTPPNLTFDYERQTWGNLQYARADYVQNQIRPLVVAIEQEFNRKLLTKEEQKNYYIEHVVEGLLRGSFSEQVSALQQAISCGLYTVNEARAIMNLPPLPETPIQLQQAPPAVDVQSQQEQTPAGAPTPQQIEQPYTQQGSTVNAN